MTFCVLSVPPRSENPIPCTISRIDDAPVPLNATRLTPNTMSIFHRTIPLFFLLILLVVPARAQTLSVQNGATVEVSNQATLDLEGTLMDLGDADSDALLQETNAGRVTGGQLEATRVLNAPDAADPAGLGAVISTAAGLGPVTVIRGHTAQTGGSNESIRRYYQIRSAIAEGEVSGTFTFTYHDAERNGLAEGALTPFKSADGGTSWTRMAAANRNTVPTGGNTVTLNDVSLLNRWTLGAEGNPLPVEFASLEGRLASGAAHLSWQTNSESNNSGFEVQRRTAHSQAADAWTKVGFVESTAPGGTTTNQQSYRFADEDLPYAADTLEYRLRQVNLDGTGELTDPIRVAQPASKLALQAPFPNPTSKQTTIRFALPEPTNVSLRIYDTLGRVVKTLTQGKRAGRHNIRADLSDLSNGTYFLLLEADGQSRTQRLVILE